MRESMTGTVLRSVILIAFLIQYTVGDICRIETFSSRSVGEEDQQSNTTEAPISTQLIVCPRPTDSPENHVCCYLSLASNETFNPELLKNNAEVIVGVSSMLQCCAHAHASTILPFFTDRVAICMAIVTLAVLLALTILVVVCCFWSRCPLYMACRIRYRHDDIIAYASKDDESTHLNAMPPEQKKGVNIYSPNAVKITPVAEV